MVRRFLPPLIVLSLLAASTPPPAAYAGEDAKTPAAVSKSKPEWHSYKGNPAKVQEQIKKFGFFQDIAGGTVDPEWTTGKGFKELETYLAGLEGEKADLDEVRRLFSDQMAKLAQEHYLKKHAIGDAELKKLLEDPEKLSVLLGADNEWTRRILLDALASGDSGKLDRLAAEFKKSGEGGMETFLKGLEAALKDPKHPNHAAAKKMMQRIDGGAVDAPPAREGEEDTAQRSPNERRLKRTEEALASIGFNGAQAYGQVGDRHVYQDAGGNTVSLSLATITRPDGTKEDLITVVNLNDRNNPKGTSYSLRTDAGRLQAGVAMNLNGVSINLKVGAGGEIRMTGAKGGFQNALEPPAPPMNLNQLYAYRAARVYQFGKVVTIGGKDYYAAPEAYGMLEGEGDAAKVQGYGQITYWPAEDLRKIFGEQDADGNWIDAVDPQTFDYKTLDLAGTRFAAGFNAMRPDLGATVIKREGLQDVQILRASAGQDASGRWWDAVFENGQYVLKPGLPPQEPGIPGTPATPQIPAEEAQKIADNLNKTLQDRIPNAPFNFAFTQDGRLGLFVGQSGWPMPFVSDPTQVGFFGDAGALLTYPVGGGGFAMTDLAGYAATPENGTFPHTVVLRPSGAGFTTGAPGGANGKMPASVVEKLFSGELTSLNPKFQFPNQPQGLKTLLAEKMAEYPAFASLSGNSDRFNIDLRAKDGTMIALTFSYNATAGKWEAMQTPVDETLGSPNSIRLAAGPSVDASRFVDKDAAPGVVEGYTAIVKTDNAGVYTQNDPKADAPQAAFLKFVVLESPDLKPAAGRTAGTGQLAYLLESPLRTVLMNHPVSKKDRITAADLEGFRFNTNIRFPATADFTRTDFNNALTPDFTETDPNHPESGVVWLSYKGKRIPGGWIAAWGAAAAGLPPS